MVFKLIGRNLISLISFLTLLSILSDLSNFLYGSTIESSSFQATAFLSTNKPTIVIDKDIRIIRVCPSKETLREAPREAGVTV